MSETETLSTITLSDFRSWLQGVEDMQEDGWTPSPVQWKKIRTKINDIESTPVVQRVEQPDLTVIPQQFSTPYIPPYQSPTARPPFNPPRSFVDNPKTPDVDTSNGSYTAPFV